MKAYVSHGEWYPVTDVYTDDLDPDDGLIDLPDELVARYREQRAAFVATMNEIDEIARAAGVEP